MKKLNILIKIFIVFFLLCGDFLYFTKQDFNFAAIAWNLVYVPFLAFIYLAAAAVAEKGLDAVYLFGLVVVVITDIFIFPLAFFHYFKKEKEVITIKRWPPVSILIPAYNEEVNIARTIQTVYDADYPGDKEIIVINDGSFDRTEEIAEDYVQRGMIELVNRVNGGKTNAMNTGLISARGEIIVVIDGDGVINKDALIELVKRFQDPKVSAVAGNIKVANRVNAISKIQHLEYLRDINIARRAFCMINCVMVVPGPLGGFRRDMLYSIGTYDDDTKTEDFDLTIQILKAKRYKIDVTQDAIAYTEAPIKWKDLYKQRVRWYGGMFETLRKHKDIIGINKSQYGNLGRFGGLYSAVTLTIIPVLEMFVFLCFIVFLTMSIIAPGSVGAPINFLLPFFTFIAIEMLLTVIALAMDKGKLHHAIWALAFVFPYKQYLNIIKIIAFFKVIVLNKEVKWNKLERTGIPPDAKN